MADWARDAIFYHIYPLGLLGAPRDNDRHASPVPRLAALHDWIPHLRGLGVTALYLGPLFESSAHGYDTADYWHVDRRLGDDGTLTELVQALHAAGIRVILDGVFHHTGRDFWAFRDLLQYGEGSRFRDWYAGVDFSRRNRRGDPFSYHGWNGHDNLVKLNLTHPEVRAHLFGAVQSWIERFQIDGLRLDAADALDLGFQSDLAAFCRGLRPDFWLLGEVVHGDYRRWVNRDTLDAVTNYQGYKALWSAHNDGNFHELAFTLNRQFGPEGSLRGAPLYSFAENHDVNRIASLLHNPAHLYTLYALLFTMPGVPSIYYGGEWGIGGVKARGDDGPLRPALAYPEAACHAPHPDLAAALAGFARIRHCTPALRHGDYRQLHVGPRQFAFARAHAGRTAVVAVNAADGAVPLRLSVDAPDGTAFVDALAPGWTATVQRGSLAIDAVPPCWARILVQQ